MKLIVAALVVLIAAMLWIASEEHYQGCVNAAAATTAAPEVEAGTNPWSATGKDSGADRSAAVAGCSRLP